MTIGISLYRARVGGFHDRAAQMSVFKRAIMSASGRWPFLVLYLEGSRGINVALILFTLLNNNQASNDLHTNKKKLHKKAQIYNTDQSWKSYRQIRNDLTYAVRKRKLDYLQDLDNRASSSATFGTKNWWKLVKSFMSNKGSDPDVIPPLEKDGVTYYTNKEKATILNQFFINQSTIEDNDDVPDVPELLTSINK